MNEQQVFEAVFKATGVSDFQKAISGARESIKSFENVSEKLKDTGKTLTKAVTLPLVGLGVAAVKLGADYDDQMSTVQAVTSASADEIERLSNLARDMGKNTRYSASEAASAQENLARAGFTTGEIMDALGSTLNLATSGALSLDEASGIAARTIRGFGLEASEAGRVSDVLAYTAAATNTTVGGLGETFKYVAPTAAGLGIEMEEVAAAAGLMGDAGIDAGQAGNMLRRGLLNLASPTKQQAGLLNELGLEMFDAEGNMKPLVDVVGELEKGLDGMTAQQQTAALSTLFGAQAVSGWTAVVNEGSDSLADLTGRIQESDGYAQGFAETAEDNLAGSFRSMRSSLEEAMLSIYEFGQGPIRDLVDRLTGLIDKFSEMNPAMQQVIIIVGVLAAAIGPLLMLIGQMGLGVSALGKFFVGTSGSVSMFAKVIAALTSPVTLVIAAIAALAGVIVYLYQTNEEFRNKVQEIWTNIQLIFEEITMIISEVLTMVFGTLSAWWEENQQGFMDIVTTVWTAISEFFIVIFTAIGDIINAIWQPISDWYQENNELIGETISVVWNAIADVFMEVMTIIGDLVTAGFNIVSSVIEAVMPYVETIIDNVMYAIMNVISLVMGIISGDWDAVWNSIKNIAQSVWDAIKALVEGAIEVVKATITSVLDAIFGDWDAKWNQIKDTVSEIWEGIKSAVSEKIEDVKTSVSDGIQGALDTVTGFFDRFKEAGGNIIGNIADGINGAIGKVTGAISGVVSKVRDFLPFSPAKEGPLKDLDRLNFGGTIADSIYKDENKMQKAMNRALNVDMPMMNGRVTHEMNNNLSTQPLHLNVNIGGQNFRGFVENISNEQGRITDLELQF